MDYGLGGSFTLNTPQDLFEKLKFDYERMKSDPENAYAAFDFFVTANCMPDWTWPSATQKQQTKNRKVDPIPRICHHLADGAKHFLLESEHHGVESANFYIDLTVYEVEGEIKSDSTSGLYIQFQPREATELGKASMTTIEFGALVLEYWSRQTGFSL